jgi:hypothetical protein
VMGIIQIPQYNQAMEPTHSTGGGLGILLDNYTLHLKHFNRDKIISKDADREDTILKNNYRGEIYFGVKALRQHSVQGCDDLAHNLITCACHEDHANSIASMKQHVNNSS